MKRIPLLLCLVVAGSLSGCAAPPPGGGGYSAYQYYGYGPRYDDYYGYGPDSRWGYADRRVRTQFTRQMPPSRGNRGDRGRGTGPQQGPGGRFSGNANQPGKGPGGQAGRGSAPGNFGPR